MILSDNEILERLESKDNLVNRLIIHQRIGRGEETPLEIKKVACLLTNEGEKGTRVAEEFDITQSNVSTYKSGRIGSQQRTQSEELKEVIASVNLKRATVEDKAIDALLESIEIMKPQLAEVNKPKVLSSIARDMAGVARDLRGSRGEEEGFNKGVHLHLHVPRIKTLDDYEVIDV